MDLKRTMLAATIMLGTLAGCASTGVMPLTADTVQMTVEAVGACSSTQTQQLALKHAAVATLQRGFDWFVVTQASDSSKLSAFQQPTVATTQGTRHGSRTAVTGGTQWWESPRTVLPVKMYRAGERGADRALDAKSVLGHDWAKLVHEGAPNTCW